MVTSDFSFFTNSQLIFGVGKANDIHKSILKFGKKILFVIGGKSFEKSGKLKEVCENLDKNGIVYNIVNIKTEPTPDIIDDVVTEYKDQNIEVVVAIGGGSVIDAGKAISAMLTQEDNIKEYLEGVGTKIHNGKKIPFIAVPTTAGTGSEATKNAVISEIGENGYKKSLRHDNFIPDVVILDASLAINCPANVTAASGMDALTQLLESFVSPKGSILSDVMALEGLENVINSIETAYSDGTNIEARSGMAFGAYLSGVTLMNAGLGVVHGFASSVGGYFDIPHGVICGTLLANATKINIEKLYKNSEYIALHKYAKVGYLFKKEKYNPETDLDEGLSYLQNELERLTVELKLDKLGKYGVTKNDLEKICKITENKNNPVKLSYEDIYEIIEGRL